MGWAAPAPEGPPITRPGQPPATPSQSCRRVLNRVPCSWPLLYRPGIWCYASSILIPVTDARQYPPPFVFVEATHTQTADTHVVEPIQRGHRSILTRALNEAGRFIGWRCQRRVGWGKRSPRGAGDDPMSGQRRRRWHGIGSSPGGLYFRTVRVTGDNRFNGKRRDRMSL